MKRLATRAPVVFVLSLGMLAVAGMSASALTHSATSHADAACTNGQIDSWLNTAGNGAAGTVYYELEFTNISATSCSLQGFPGVSAVTIGHHQIGVPATRSGPASGPVVIAPDHTAHAALGVVDTANFPRHDCEPVTAFGLKVYAPNQTAFDIIPWPFSTCSTATASLHIQSVKG